MTRDSNFAIMSQIAGQAKIIELEQMLLLLMVDLTSCYGGNPFLND